MKFRATILFILSLLLITFLFFSFSKISDNSLESFEEESETEEFKESKKDHEKCDEMEVASETSKSIAVEKRDSKIGSTLEFSYIHEGCEKLIDEDSKSFQIPEDFSGKQSCPLPVIPIHQNLENCKPNKKKNKKISEELKKVDADEVHPDLYDKYLEPKPEVDSPYGFVFLPNKYWKQLQTKPPVCIPSDRSIVQPSCTSGVPVDVLDYTQIGSIMPKFSYREEFD